MLILPTVSKMYGYFIASAEAFARCSLGVSVLNRVIQKVVDKNATICCRSGVKIVS